MEPTTTSDSKKTGATYGSDVSLQDKIMKQIRELGDTLERAGEKIEGKGWETIGQAIYKLGNSLEHLQEGKFKSSKAYTDKEFDDKSKKFSGSTVSTDKVGGNDSQAY